MEIFNGKKKRRIIIEMRERKSHIRWGMWLLWFEPRTWKTTRVRTERYFVVPSAPVTVRDKGIHSTSVVNFWTRPLTSQEPSLCYDRISFDSWRYLPFLWVRLSAAVRKWAHKSRQEFCWGSGTNLPGKPLLRSSQIFPRLEKRASCGTNNKGLSHDTAAADFLPWSALADYGHSIFLSIVTLVS